LSNLLIDLCFHFWNGLKGCNKKTAAMHPEAIKTRSKRVFAEPQTTRSTRSKKTTSYRDASLAPNEIFVPSSSLSHGSQVEEVGNFDGHTHATTEG
jgi:hypothetical protein